MSPIPSHALVTEKKALLISIEYRGSTDKQVPNLKDIGQDLDRLRDHLITSRSYLPQNIVQLTEDQPDSLQPTKANIVCGATSERDH